MSRGLKVMVAPSSPRRQSDPRLLCGVHAKRPAVATQDKVRYKMFLACQNLKQNGCFPHAPSWSDTCDAPVHIGTTALRRPQISHTWSFPTGESMCGM